MTTSVRKVQRRTSKSKKMQPVPKEAAWMVRWTLLGHPLDLTWDQLVHIPAQALQTNQTFKAPEGRVRIERGANKRGMPIWRVWRLTAKGLWKMTPIKDPGAVRKCLRGLRRALEPRTREICPRTRTQPG